MLPVFLFAVMAMASLFSAELVQLRLQKAMEAAAARASAYYFVSELPEVQKKIGADDWGDIQTALIQGGITSVYLLAETIDEAGAVWIDRSGIRNGRSGFNILGSRLPDGDGNLDYILNYKYKIMFLPESVGCISITQRVFRRVWVGNILPEKEDEQKQEEQMVYITEKGTVYHLIPDCTYIKIAVSAVDAGAVDDKRSADGSRYYPCELCGNGTGQVVYITKNGNRYHCNINCSAIKRTVSRVPLSEVENRHCCSKCGSQ